MLLSVSRFIRNKVFLQSIKNIKNYEDTVASAIDGFDLNNLV